MYELPEYRYEIPTGLCADRIYHLPHAHNSTTLGKFWCTANQQKREPGYSEYRRKGK